MMEGNGSYPSDYRHDEEHTAELMRAVEALIFAADEPLGARVIAEVIAEITQEAVAAPAQIDRLVDRLNEAYEHRGAALRIRRWAGGYRVSTTQEVAPYLKALFRQDRRRRLTRSLLETLAILAYKQPATKPEVDFVRGVDSDYTLRKLMELDLVDVVGRADSIGRPLLYGTTDEFLDAFALESLDELPNLREIEALLNDPAFNRERARLLMLRGLSATEPTDPTENDQENA